jgi:lysophospholipase L1-like esterase
VIALGASSTFGYFDRDEETYPAYLEEHLRAALAAQPLGDFTDVEVLNFGIPHLESDQIRALFEAEALGADPDVVTFYEGVNDTRRLERQTSERAFNWVASKLLLVRWVQLTLWDRLESFDGDDLGHHLEDKASFFVGNIEAMAKACDERGILFVPILQQATSKTLTRDELKVTSYAEEEAIIRGRLEQTGRLSGLELVFLIHCELNRGLKAWAEANAQAFVDVVALFDELKQRHHLVSWVHMSPHGNRLIAEALGDEILKALRAD